MVALAAAVPICKMTGKLRYLFILMAIPVLVVTLGNWTLVFLTLPISVFASLGAYLVLKQTQNHSLLVVGAISSEFVIARTRPATP